MNTTDLDYHVGELVELAARECVSPCERDCGCHEMVARNGWRGQITDVHIPMSGGEAYYAVDGLPWIVYGCELRSVTDDSAVQP